MKSFFVGFGWVLLLTVLAPIVLMWIIGERKQGRASLPLSRDMDPTLAGAVIIGSTALWAAFVAATIAVRMHS